MKNTRLTSLNNFNSLPVVDPYSHYMLIFNRAFKMKYGYQLIAAKYHMTYSFMSIDFCAYAVKFSTNLSMLEINELLIYRIMSDEKHSILSEEERKLSVYHSSETLSNQFVIQTLPI